MITKGFCVLAICLFVLPECMRTSEFPTHFSDFGQNGGNESRVMHARYQTKWFTHGELIINGTEYYGFDTSDLYNFNDPDHTTKYAEYTPSGVNPITAVNESSFTVFATDYSEEEFEFSCRYSLLSSPEINSEGTSYVGVQYTPYIPPNCEICYDTRTLGTADSAWHLTSGASPEVGTGILLYRSNSTGSFLTWDGYKYLSSFQNDSSLRLPFGPNLCVQIAILYEVHNWDDGWWLWQHHSYFHNIGIYTFQTTSI